MPAETTASVPDKGIRPGLNIGAADIPEGTFVVLTGGAGDAPYSIAVSGDGAGVLGVTMELIVGTDNAPNGTPRRGNVQIVGKARVIAGAATTRGGPIASDASGNAIDAASADIVVGQGVTVGVDTEFMEVELAGPGGGRIVP